MWNKFASLDSTSRKPRDTDEPVTEKPKTKTEKNQHNQNQHKNKSNQEGPKSTGVPKETLQNC